MIEREAARGLCAVSIHSSSFAEGYSSRHSQQLLKTPPVPIEQTPHDAAMVLGHMPSAASIIRNARSLLMFAAHSRCSRRRLMDALRRRSWRAGFLANLSSRWSKRASRGLTGPHACGSRRGAGRRCADASITAPANPMVSRAGGATSAGFVGLRHEARWWRRTGQRFPTLSQFR